MLTGTDREAIVMRPVRILTDGGTEGEGRFHGPALPRPLLEIGGRTFCFGGSWDDAAWVVQYNAVVRV